MPRERTVSLKTRRALRADRPTDARETDEWKSPLCAGDMRRGDILGSGPGTVDRACRASGRRARDDGEDVRRRVGGRSARRARRPAHRALARWALALFLVQALQIPALAADASRGRVRGVDGGDARRPHRAASARTRSVAGAGADASAPGSSAAGPSAAEASRRCRGCRRRPVERRRATTAETSAGNLPGDASTRDVPDAPAPTPVPDPAPIPAPAPAPNPASDDSGVLTIPDVATCGATNDGFGDRILRQTSVSDARHLACVTEATAGAVAARVAAEAAAEAAAESRAAAKRKAEKDKKIPSLRDFKTYIQAKVSAARDANKETEKEKAAAAGEGERAAAADPTRSRPNPRQTQRRRSRRRGFGTTDGPPRARAAEIRPRRHPGGRRTRRHAGRDARERRARRSRPRDAIWPPRRRRRRARIPREIHADARRDGDEGRRASRRDGRAFGARRVGGVVGIRLGLVREVSRRGVECADGDARGERRGARGARGTVRRAHAGTRG